MFGGNIGLLFHDVTTLYFETDKEDDLCETGFSKEGLYKNPPVILGLLVSLDGYPLAYYIHEGNKYEGHTMLPVELERLGYRYIIGARIKTESEKVKSWILEQPKTDRTMVEYDKGGGRGLLVGYTDDRAKKDAYNSDKGTRRLEKAYRTGKLTKENFNKRGYNKFLDLKGDATVTINYDKLREDAEWDGLKGYLTNTDIPTEAVYAAYHNLWNVERAFRIAKSKIEVRPMFHFTRRGIEAHVCICFVALKVYKELERLLNLSHVNMSVDKVLAMAQTVTTIEVKLPLSKECIRKTMLMERHKRIASLFSDEFWVTR